jgi:hypothetical protein
MLKNAAVVAQGSNPTHDLAFDLPQYLADNAPFLQKYLEQQPAEDLKEAQLSQLFQDLTGVWEHVDDIAFKHRVFYADYQGRMRPLQFTLMHKRCYDELLGEVNEAYSAKSLFEQDLAKVVATDSLAKTLKTEGISDLLRELRVSTATRTFLEPLRQMGQFDSIDFNEAELGVGNFVADYLCGKLTKAELFSREQHRFLRTAL